MHRIKATCFVFMSWVVLGALLSGLIIGAIPLFYGAFRQKLALGVSGFILCIISALILGAILALPVAAIFVFLIKRGAR